VKWPTRVAAAAAAFAAGLSLAVPVSGGVGATTPPDGQTTTADEQTTTDGEQTTTDDQTDAGDEQTTTDGEDVQGDGQQTTPTDGVPPASETVPSTTETVPSTTETGPSTTETVPSSKPSYVALGDSFTAGPLIPVQVPPPGCLKSDHNYPHLAEPRLGLPEFRDASCSGAKTDHMTKSQNVDPDPDPPPQFDALDENTKIVTIGIGGNDIGFSEIAENCPSATNAGTPCQDRYVVDGHDELSERIADTAPKVAAVLRGIHSRSPDADVYVVNYLPILPDKGAGCHPQVPVTDGDVPYLRGIHKKLNEMLATEAAANDATLVNAYKAGIGHDACKLPTVRWVEPAAPASPAAPLHPNLDGMTGTANALVGKVRGR
jgi:lysophospholipase L1-like esterase